jgi:hypothetical protein
VLFVSFVVTIFTQPVDYVLRGELMIHHRARKILVVCPSTLQIPWRDPLRAKFGLDFRIIDSSPMRELRRRRGIHVTS